MASNGVSRTWSRRPGARTLGTIGTSVVCVVLLAAVPLVLIGPGRGFERIIRCLFAAALVLAVVRAVAATLREVHEVTLEPDGTLELVRPLGSVRIAVGQIRSVSLHPYQDSPGLGPILMATDRGTYSINRRLTDVRGLIGTLRERNPRIALPDA